MISAGRFFKFIICKKPVRNTNAIFSSINSHVRTFADTPKTDTSSKKIAVQGTEKEERLRVRRARSSDVPGVLKFVRENASTAWPGLVVPQSVSDAVVSDYVSRALAQGHSMLAEQQEARRSWSQIRGLAIGASICPWDASLLEKWARCVRCSKSRRLMFFTAHCLRGPGLHDKYKVHSILQVILFVPQNTTSSKEVVQILAKNAIQRGRDVGFSLIRFDVTDANVAKSLEELQLKKEWQLAYKMFPQTNTDKSTKENPPPDATDAKETEINKEQAPGGSNLITVYTAFTQAEKRSQ